MLNKCTQLLVIVIAVVLAKIYIHLLSTSNVQGAFENSVNNHWPNTQVRSAGTWPGPCWLPNTMEPQALSPPFSVPGDIQRGCSTDSRFAASLQKDHVAWTLGLPKSQTNPCRVTEGNRFTTKNLKTKLRSTITDKKKKTKRLYLVAPFFCCRVSTVLSLVQKTSGYSG